MRFIPTEAASGVALLLCALIAVALANSPLAAAYHALWSTPLATVPMIHWVNDGLMTLFFLVVGLEIKRELLEGELASRSKASLPLVAAAGGMIVPALIYTALNAGTPGASGWGIPCATDIAFALGVLTILGNRIPPALKAFLLALAIADDIGAVAIIAIFYTGEIAWRYLAAGTGVLGALALMNRLRIGQAALYLIAGVPLWECLLRSGVHPTIAGVLLAAVIPPSTGQHIQRILHPWVAFGLMPIFALANAGVNLAEGISLHRVGAGITLGLIAGKPIGITLFSWISVRLKMASLPSQVSWPELFGVACLGGIGFTMSIFIAHLALSDAGLVNSAKTAVLGASVISACVGALLLSRLHVQRRQKSSGR